MPSPVVGNSANISYSTNGAQDVDSKASDQPTPAQTSNTTGSNNSRHPDGFPTRAGLSKENKGVASPSGKANIKTSPKSASAAGKPTPPSTRDTSPATPAPDKNPAREALHTISIELGQLELDLIEKAKQFFGGDDFKLADKLDKYPPGDPRPWLAKMEIIEKLQLLEKKMPAVILADESTGRQTEYEAMKTLSEQIAEQDKDYWTEFEAMKTSDPKYYYGATTLIESVKCLYALSKFDQANSKIKLDELGNLHAAEPHSSAAGAAKNQTIQTKDGISRMTEAMLALLPENQKVKDGGKTTSQKEELQIEADEIKALGEEWEKLNEKAWTDLKAEAEEAEIRYAKLQTDLRNMVKKIEDAHLAAAERVKAPRAETKQAADKQAADKQAAAQETPAPAKP